MAGRPIREPTVWPHQRRRPPVCEAIAKKQAVPTRGPSLPVDSPAADDPELLASLPVDSPATDDPKLGPEEQKGSEMELMRDRPSKVLLGKDMSGNGKGVFTVLTISNAMTNVCGSYGGWSHCRWRRRRCGSETWTDCCAQAIDISNESVVHNTNSLRPHSYFQQLAQTHNNGNANRHMIKLNDAEPVRDDGTIVVTDANHMLD